MPRTLTAAMQTALQSNNRPRYLAELEFDGQTLRLWTGVYDVSWNGETWLGNGWLLGVSRLEDDTRLTPSPMTVVLAGLPDTLVSLILNSSRHGKTGTFWRAYLDDSGQIIDSPMKRFSGLFDVPVISPSPDDSTVTITYESEFIMFDQPREDRMSNEHQKSKYPADRGFEFVEALAEKQIFWGLPAEVPSA
jgi:hypothetical protein